jgi:hypothetical protein
MRGKRCNHHATVVRVERNRIVRQSAASAGAAEQKRAGALSHFMSGYVGRATEASAL